MIDPDLERRFEDCQELLKHWHNFHKYFALGVKGGDLINHERETEFLNLKSRIAMLHDSFMESLKHDQAIGQHILTLVERSITLKHINKLSIAEVKKMEIEWHESYLLLSETVASMEEQREVMAEINPTKYKMDKFRQNLGQNISAFFGSVWFKLAIIFVVIPGIFIVLAFILPFKDWAKKTDFTKNAWYGAENILRKTVMKNLDFERWKDLDSARDKEQSPANMEEIEEDYNSASAVANYIFPQAPEFGSILRGGDVKFREEAYKVDKKYNLYILMFLFEGEDSVLDAQKAMDVYNDWISSLPAPQRESFEYGNTVFRKNNVIVVLHSNGPKADRTTIKELEFGVQ